MTDAKQQLIEHISADAVFHGDFTLTSGKKASYYVDMRRVSLDHRVAPLIGQVMIDLIAEIPDIVAVGGMTMGADPIASAILHQGAIRGLSYDAFQNLRASASSFLKTRRPPVVHPLPPSKLSKRSARSSPVSPSLSIATRAPKNVSRQQVTRTSRPLGWVSWG